MKRLIILIFSILFCANIITGQIHSKTSTLYDEIETIIIEGNINASIKQDAITSNIDCVLNSDLSIIVEDKTLYIRSMSENLIPLNINVGDELRNVEISKGAICNIQNIHCSDNITLTVKDGSRVNATLNCKKLRVKANKNSRVEIKGTCKILLSAESKRRSIIDISELKCEVVRDVIAYGKSTVKLNATKIDAVSRHPKSIIIINNTKL